MYAVAAAFARRRGLRITARSTRYEIASLFASGACGPLLCAYGGFAVLTNASRRARRIELSDSVTSISQWLYQLECCFLLVRSGRQCSTRRDPSRLLSRR